MSTKLHAPVPRRLVSRRELLALLASGPRKLTLLRAPAGWGKSTLLADWLASARPPRAFTWLALDEGDNDPVRFWTYVIEALRRLAPKVGDGARPLLHAPGVGAVEQVLPVLINELDALPNDTVLVVDDYHMVRNSEIHDGVAFVVEHLPANVELVLSTRIEPPLPLARLRARGQLLEIGADDLRFSDVEANALLNDLHGLGVSESDVARLHRRTEGWAAGLYLAALSLRHRTDAATFVATFAGDDRHVVDYLSTEVLAGLTADVKTFLLRTSVLERLSAPLCNAVTGATGAGTMLAEIERSNFFLLALDTTRGWYRYHHLFREVLRQGLFEAEPASVPELHRRAAAWLLDAGMVSEAIGHTLAAGDEQDAAELIATHWAPTLLGAAGDRTVDAWLASLPASVIRGDVRLCFARCFIGLSLGRLDDVREWLTSAESAPLPAAFRDGVSSVEGALACVRAAMLWETGDVGGAWQAGWQARAAEAGSPWEAIGVAVIGLVHAARAEWEQALPLMAEYARIGAQTGHHLNHVSGLSTVSACHAELGEWSAAEQAAATATQLAIAHGIDEHWCTAHAHLARGLILADRGELDRAEGSLARSVELARRGAGPVSVAWPLLHLAVVQAKRGVDRATRRSLHEARDALAAAPDPDGILARLTALEGRLLTTGRNAVAGATLTERELAVLRLLPSELSQREVARAMYVSLNTVKTHTRSVFTKLGVSSRAEAVARARELDLL